MGIESDDRTSARASAHDGAIGRWENEGGDTAGLHPHERGSVVGVNSARVGEVSVRTRVAVIVASRSRVASNYFRGKRARAT